MYKNKEMTNTSNTKFLGPTLDNTFSWKNHIDTIVPKLSSACSTVRAVKPFLSQESLWMVYFSYFHSKMAYRLIFWGNSYHRNTVFKLEERIRDKTFIPKIVQVYKLYNSKIRCKMDITP
jgi:hypothetical protein